MDAFITARAAVGWCSPAIDQAVLADFITEGHFISHVRRMRPIYAERQAALIDALGRKLGDRLEVKPADAGIHLSCSLPDYFDDKAVAREAAVQGVMVRPLSAFSVGGPGLPRSGLVLGYGAYDVRQIKEAAGKLAVAFKTVRPVSASLENRRRRLRSSCFGG